MINTILGNFSSILNLGKGLLFRTKSGLGKSLDWLYTCFAGEAVNNNNGLGFNGYDEQGNAKWDLLNNVEIFKLEVRILFYLC